MAKQLSILERLHLEQIGHLLWRKGIELAVPGSSDLTSYVRDLFLLNQTSLHYDAIWEWGARDGCLLIYIFPTNGGYFLRYFRRKDFSVSFDASGAIVLADLTWQDADGKSSHRVRLTPDTVYEWSGVSFREQPDSEYPNPYSFVPVVLINNKQAFPGSLGFSEFEDLQQDIDAYNDTIAEVRGNIDLNAGPILYTSRTRAELEESNIIPRGTNEYGGALNSKRRTVRLRSIVDNYDPSNDVLGYLAPPALNPQLLLYLGELRRSLRVALGSVDETRIANDALILRTPSELSLALSFATNTALKRSRSYITFGVCLAYEYALRMALVDGAVDLGDLSLGPFGSLIRWRYLGDIWQSSPADDLKSSIVARNMLRLGVSPTEVLRYLFPDLEASEIERMQDGGFSYEFFSGLAEFIATMESTSLSGKLSDFIGPYLDKEINTNHSLDNPLS